MKLRFLIIYLIIFAVLGTAVCIYVARGSKQDAPSYPTEINRLVIRLGKEWDSVCDMKEQQIPSDEPFDYAVIDPEGNLLFYTEKDIATSVSAATARYDVIRDIEKDGVLVGRLLVHNPFLELQARRDRRQALIIAGLFMLMLLISLAYLPVRRKRT